MVIDKPSAVGDIMKTLQTRIERSRMMAGDKPGNG
jgi:hypothetical protein